MARDSLDMSGSDSESSLLDSIPDGSVRLASTLNTPTVHLLCRPNSHRFDDRIIPLNEPVKVGRSVAKLKPTHYNAIFDCKVLSRNHALITYEDGKFYVQDTQSSNGTFVNDNRLSKGSEELVRREIYSGDVLQFGVNVIENSKKVTHGCVVALVRLYQADGTEHTSSQKMNGGQSLGNLSCSDSYALVQAVYDASQRETALREKINILHEVVKELTTAAESSWQAVIGEERLLSKIETLEGKLKALGTIEHAAEVTKLISEREVYETNAKESISKAFQDKLTTIRKCDELEFLHKTLSAQLRETETENEFLKQQLADFTSIADSVSKENEDLVAKHEETRTSFEEKLSELEEEKAKVETRLQQVEIDLEYAKAEAKRKLESPQSEKGLTIEEAASESEDKISLDSFQGETKCSKEEILRLDEVINQLKSKVTQLETDNDQLQRDIEEQTKSFAEKMKAELADSMDRAVQLTMYKREAERVMDLEQQLGLLLDSNDRLEKELKLRQEKQEQSFTQNILENIRNNDTVQPVHNEDTTMQLKNEIRKLKTELTTVKESYAKCQQDKSDMRKDFDEMQKEFGGMARQFDTVCKSAVVPLVIICFAIFFASHSFYSVFGSTKS